MTSEIFQAIFESLTPILLGLFLSTLNLIFLWLFVGLYIFLEIFNRIAFYFYNLGLSIIQGSLNISAHQFFLTVDPIYHSTKSSGRIQSKIQATGREFSSTVDILIFNLIYLFVAFISIIIAMLNFSALLSVVTTVSLLLVSLLIVAGNIKISRLLTPIWIKYRDKWGGLSVENLYQNALIRSTFTTETQIDKTKSFMKKALEARTISFFGRSMIVFVIRMIIMATSTAILLILRDMIMNDLIDGVVAVSLIVVYLNGVRQVVRLGRFVSAFADGVENLNDLWKFINNFGKQTYPVLEKNEYEK